MRLELLVSDLAGTILSDDGVVLAAYRQAFTAHNIEWDEQELATLRGASKRMVFERFAVRTYLEDQATTIASEALNTFQTALTSEYESGDLREIDGATGALETLKHAGVKLAVTSGFPRALVDLIVRRLEWQAIFDAVIGADEVPAGRPAPYMIHRAMEMTGTVDVRRVAVVGDTPLDLEAAGNAGAGCAIGVLSGAHGIETLGMSPHTYLLPGIASLPVLFGIDAPYA